MPPVYRVLLFSLLLVLSGLGLFGEKIPVNNQTGWDGKHYANLTINFQTLAAQKQIDSYQYQRILTPAVIHYTAKLVDIPLTSNNIVRVFSYYNLVLILCAALLFFKLSTFLKLTIPTEIIGFSILFLNVFILKNTPYYPVLTDTTAFFMGFLVVYFYLTNKPMLLYCTILLGQFCYPLFLIASFPLALNIRSNSFSLMFKDIPVYKILAIVTITIICFGWYQLLVVPNTVLPKYTMELNTLLLPISIIGVCLYAWRSLSAIQLVTLTNGNPSPLWPTIGKGLGIIFFWLLTTFFVTQISIPEEVFTPMVFIYNLLQQCIANPFVFVVAHITYIGPGLILVLLFYTSFLKTVVNLGDSAIGYFIIISCLSIGSETRQFIHFLPFMVIVLLISLNSYTISIKQAILFLGLSLLASKCWFPINTPHSFTDYNYANFPNQRYFMNQGPFMSTESYWINLCIAIVMGIILWKVFRKIMQPAKHLTP
jgi:hypothetical protein